jgi:hypothetical protein
MADYFQLGSELNRPQYSGDDSTSSFYGAQTKLHTVFGNPTIVAADTLEVPLFELPAGVRVNGIKWVCASNLGTNVTATVVLRKKTNVINPATTIAGAGGGAADGVAAGVAGLITVSLNGQTITTTGNAAGSTTIIPTEFEGSTVVNGITAKRNTTQEAYYVSVKFTFGATPTWVPTSAVPVDFFLGLESEFVGTL